MPWFVFRLFSCHDIVDNTMPNIAFPLELGVYLELTISEQASPG
jgi:hypothetical protein